MDESYQGPRLDGDLSPEFMKELLEWLKKEKKLHRKYAYKVHTVISSVCVHHIFDSSFISILIDHTVSTRDYEEPTYVSGCVNTRGRCVLSCARSGRCM